MSPQPAPWGASRGTRNQGGDGMANQESKILRQNAEEWATEAEAMADELRTEALQCLNEDPLRAWELCRRAGLLRVAARERKQEAKWLR